MATRTRASNKPSTAMVARRTATPYEFQFKDIHKNGTFVFSGPVPIISSKFQFHDGLRFCQVVGSSTADEMSEDDRLQHSAIIPRIVALRSEEATQTQGNTVSESSLVRSDVSSDSKRKTSGHTSSSTPRPGPVPRLPPQVIILDKLIPCLD